jgi:hypothetical protein
MSDRHIRSMGVFFVIATWGALSACAGSSERLPECKGRAVPINRSSVAGATDVGTSVSPSVVVAVQDPAGGARDAE